MKHSIICLLFLVGFFSLKGQQITIRGTITDGSGAAISHCSVRIPNSAYGTVTDEKGAFQLTVNNDSAAHLYISALGYESKEVDVRKLLAASKNSVLIIKLNAINIKLTDATIAAKKKSTKKGILGKRNLDDIGGCYMQYGEEVAVFLQAKPDIQEGYLEKIFFYVTDEGAPVSRFKVNVYKNFDDTALEIMPGEKLMDSVYAHATKGNSWVSVDVSDKKIPVKGGVFISMEWVSDSNNKLQFAFDDPKAWHYCGSKDHRDKYHNGQVLGTTWGYGVLSKTFIRDHSHNYEWRYRESPFTNDRFNALDRLQNKIHPGYYPNQEHHWYNPMIYATYIYYK